MNTLINWWQHLTWSHGLLVLIVLAFVAYLVLRPRRKKLIRMKGYKLNPMFQRDYK